MTTRFQLISDNDLWYVARLSDMETTKKPTGKRKEMKGIRNKVQKKCKIGGISLRRDALTEIFSFVVDFEDTEDKAIDLILEELQNQSRNLFLLLLLLHAYAIVSCY